ncbi:nitrogen regulation protein NR(II) [Aliivibrio kagoshimensis]
MTMSGDTMTNLSETLLNNLVTAAVLLDEELAIAYANPSAEQLFSQSARRLDKLKLTKLIQHTSLDLSLFTQPLISGQSITDSDVTLVIDHRPVMVEITVSPVSWDKKIMLLVELRQIGKQRRLSQEISQHAQQMAAKVLVRNLAHEIKNPLGGLRGAAQLLEKMLPDPSLKEYTQLIVEQADRLRNLVDRLLGPQRLGKKQENNIHVVLEKARQIVELANEGEIKFIRDYDPSLPDFLMDSEQIEQAFLNVISNAAQALENQQERVITLRTRTEYQTNIHGHQYRLSAKVEITDNGPGIPKEIQDTLFYPMVSAREGGTGLGLSISQNLIDQHKGKIEVISWPGQTTFTLYLPIK